jgi:hypothetical protein
MGSHWQDVEITGKMARNVLHEVIDFRSTLSFGILVLTRC